MTCIIWATISATSLAGASLLFFGFTAWAAFLDSITRINQAILTEGGSDFFKLLSLYGYARALGFGAYAAWPAQGTMISVLAAFVSWL